VPEPAVLVDPSRPEEVADVLLSDWRILLRRWYVILAGVLVTAGLAYAAATVIPARYDTTATVLMLPPETTVNGKRMNPYLNLGGLEGAADVVSSAMGDRTVQAAVAGEGLDVEYSLGRDYTIAGPVILLEVTGATPSDALEAQEYLLGVLPERLDRLQEDLGVLPGSRITSQVITTSQEADTNRRSQIRAVLVAVVGGLGLTYLLTAFVDGVAMSRRRARAATRPDPEQPGSAPPAADVPVATSPPGGDEPAGDRVVVTADGRADPGPVSSVGGPTRWGPGRAEPVEDGRRSPTEAPVVPGSPGSGLVAVPAVVNGAGRRPGGQSDGTGVEQPEPPDAGERAEQPEPSPDGPAGAAPAPAPGEPRPRRRPPVTSRPVGSGDSWFEPLVATEREREPTS
jgi:hypothetical protein